MLIYAFIFLIISGISSVFAFTKTKVLKPKWPRFVFFIFATMFLAILFIEMLKM